MVVLVLLVVGSHQAPSANCANSVTHEIEEDALKRETGWGLNKSLPPFLCRECCTAGKQGSVLSEGADKHLL